MHTWIIAAATAVAGLAAGALIGIATTGAVVKAIADAVARATLKQHHSPTADDAQDAFDPEEERLDLIAIRDLLVATTIVGAFNGGCDANLQHALGELRTAADAAHDRFDDLIVDLDDATGVDTAEDDAAEPEGAAVDA